MGSGACWGSARLLGALSPAQSPALPSPTSHFQGDSSFVVMTNFIATPRQAQGHCAEVRTFPSSPLGPAGKNTRKRKPPWASEGKPDRLPAGTTVVEFQAQIYTE